MALHPMALHPMALHPMALHPTSNPPTRPLTLWPMQMETCVQKPTQRALRAVLKEIETIMDLVR